jgi:hypothetical protein
MHLLVFRKDVYQNALYNYQVSLYTSIITHYDLKVEIVARITVLSVLLMFQLST